MKKRVLLIGDSLQSGYNTVTPLMQEYQLRVFVNKPIKLYNEEYVENFYGSLNNYEDVLLAVTGCDVVVVSNTASSGRVSVVGLENIRKAIAQAGIKRVIYAQSKRGMGGDNITSAEDNVAFNHWG